MKLPELVIPCPICNTKGEHEQTYNIGCGRGLYKSLGPCDFCHIEGYFMESPGYVYKDTMKGIPKSVLNQIKIANNIVDE